MFAKKGMAVLLAVLLAVVPCTILYNRNGIQVPAFTLRQAVEEKKAAALLESYVKRNLPRRRTLQGVGVWLGLAGGNKEQNGIFISDDILMKNIGQPDQGAVQRNTEAVLQFAEQASEMETPVYFMLVPTACAIFQENLPRYADTFNQREFIEGLYTRMYGKASTVDVYTPLFSARERYLYYRTENNLTSLGGYYVYSALSERLGIQGRTLNQFDVEYITHSYYGDLYDRSPYKNIRPDVLALYHYNGGLTDGPGREYRVVHRQEGQEKAYHTLYPEHMLALNRGLDVYLGGLSAVTTVETSVSNTRSLLLFGDETALAYLPFLCNHYQRITVVDLELATQEDLAGLVPADYGQVLFAYSVEHFTDSDSPARAMELLEE